jgi:hypothetical protein
MSNSQPQSIEPKEVTRHRLEMLRKRKEKLERDDARKDGRKK